MATRDDGGPAFAHGDHTNGGHPGMSLRDWFAGQALAGLLASNQGQNQNELAWLAYAAADAMLAARKTEGE
jgi:hypothetical protein